MKCHPWDAELLARFRTDMQLRNLSPRTIYNYLLIAKALGRFLGKPLARLEPEDLRRYAVHLRLERNLSPGYCNQVGGALSFLYGETLGRPKPSRVLPRARTPVRLPRVLSVDEVRAVLERGSNLKARTLFHVLYSAGLRVSEAVGLRVEDVDSQRMLLRVQHGKGDKERYVMLSPLVLDLLRQYWRAYRPQNWMFFPREDRSRPLTPRAVQISFQRACRAAGLKKRPPSIRCVTAGMNLSNPRGAVRLVADDRMATF